MMQKTNQSIHMRDRRRAVLPCRLTFADNEPPESNDGWRKLHCTRWGSACVGDGNASAVSPRTWPSFSTRRRYRSVSPMASHRSSKDAWTGRARSESTGSDKLPDAI